MITERERCLGVAQELANRTGEPHYLLSRSCDRWMVRAESEAQSALSYATLSEIVKPEIAPITTPSTYGSRSFPHKTDAQAACVELMRDFPGYQFFNWVTLDHANRILVGDPHGCFIGYFADDQTRRGRDVNEDQLMNSEA